MWAFPAFLQNGRVCVAEMLNTGTFTKRKEKKENKKKEEEHEEEQEEEKEKRNY